MDNARIVQTLLQDVVMAIVPDHDAVLVKHTIDPDGEVHYTVTCNPADTRFLIGKQGANSMALKTITRAAGQKLGFKADLYLDVPERPENR